MPARLVPSPVAEIQRALLRTRGSGWFLAGGRLLDGFPSGAAPIPTELFPPSLRASVAADHSDRERVLARIDIEETTAFARPLLYRSDLGRDFYLGDDSGRALIKVGDAGRAHPDVELHLDGEFISAAADPEGENENANENANANDDDDDDQSDDVRRAIYMRTIRTGDPVYVWGRALLQHDLAHAGYRDTPVEVVFSPSEMLHIYDEDAFRQLSAWRALPWYRKLSVMVRNR